MNILHEPHQQNVRPSNDPFVVELFLGLASDSIIGGGQGLEKLRKGTE